MANALTKVTGNVIDSTTNITAGIITATSFVGSGANLTGVASTDNIRTNTNATFLQSVNVTGIVTTAGVNASGVVTATSSIVGSAVTINASGINATGVITATSFSGSGANLTGLAATANVTTSSLVVIGVSTVAAGTTAAPSITPTGDSDTGIFFPSADTIAFGEGGAETMRVNSSGELLIGTGTRTANGGVLQISNGITFPASQSACSDVNTLDDYEEGTFTPTITGATTAGTTTYTDQIGLYTKIGRQVSVNIDVRASAATGTGFILIGGLPFVNNASSFSIGTLMVGNFNWSGGTYLVPFIGVGTNIIHLFTNADDTDYAQQSISNEAQKFILSATYHV